MYEIPALATLRPTCFSRGKLNFFSLACLTKNFAYGFDRTLLETALSQVPNETDGSKWSQNATLDFYATVLASFLR